MPNLVLDKPLRGTPDWDVPVNANWQKIMDHVADMEQIISDSTVRYISAHIENTSGTITSQSIAHNLQTEVLFRQVWDNYGIASLVGNGIRILKPGLYLYNLEYTFSNPYPTSSTGYIRFSLGGSSTNLLPVVGGQDNYFTLSAIRAIDTSSIDMTDRVSVYVRQTYGSALNLTKCSLRAYRMGPLGFSTPS